MTEHIADATSRPVVARREAARHPNASVALGSGSGLGSVVVWLVTLTGVAMPAEIGAALGGALAAFFLWVGRRGIKGAVVGLWSGEQF